MPQLLERFWMCPCDSSWGSQGYGNSHKALDFGWLTKYGANLPVKACKSGNVVAAGQITETINGKKYYPTIVVIMHPDVDCVWITRYWHLVKGSCKVNVGDTVTQGQEIGIRGNTGYSHGVHLHLEIWKCPLNYKYKPSDYNKYALNPLDYLYLFDGQVFNQSGAFKLLHVSKTVGEPKPVVEDTTRHQVEVIVDELRVRETPSLNGKQLFLCDKGIYNVLQMKEGDGYVWYEIEKDRWIATKEGSWTIDKPIVVSSNQDEIIIDLRNQLEKLETKVELRNKVLDTTIQVLKDVISSIVEVQKVVSENER